jgi:hypothetical protein
MVQNDKAIWWEGGLNIDADGAYNAYAPGNAGLDYTANAGSDGDWYGVLVDADGHPVVQGPDDPCPGGFIATTALVDHSKAVDDPRRYVDSNAINYLSIPRNAVADYGLKVGDVGFAFCRKTGQMACAVVADVGPRNKWGEGSIALARALGLPASPRNGGAEAGVVCVVFKGSGRGWPRTNADIASQVNGLLGGVDGYKAFTAPQS